MSLARLPSRTLTTITISATPSAATASARLSQACCVTAPSLTSPSPTITTALLRISVRKCSASASSAWLSYLRAARPSAREREKSTIMDTSSTPKAQGLASTAMLQKKMRWMATYTIAPHVTSNNAASTSADKFSILP